ncbi:MAG: hypothetical protein DMG16_15195 [Acidobacteria bacterium]|nr:MAG: hypothetical protein DMG16_15195 [Acidobacteriota bacterium]
MNYASSSVSDYRRRTLRDKLLQYPKLITNAVHPPLQESNCPSLKTVLQFVKDVRDAVTHPKLGLGISDTLEAKEQALHDLDFAQVELIVDASVDLARALSKTIGYSEQMIFWLIHRDGDGYFPLTALTRCSPFHGRKSGSVGKGYPRTRACNLALGILPFCEFRRHTDADSSAPRYVDT